jgi:hypothetical protein
VPDPYLRLCQTSGNVLGVMHAITVRPAYADDAAALRRLAALDSATVPPAPLLVAEVDGELSAALSLADGRAIADPFRPTAHHVELLRTQATATASARRAPRRRAHLRLA